MTGHNQWFATMKENRGLQLADSGQEQVSSGSSIDKNDCQPSFMPEVKSIRKRGGGQRAVLPQRHPRPALSAPRSLCNHFLPLAKAVTQSIPDYLSFCPILSLILP
jgi:hypothetical protein